MAIDEHEEAGKQLHIETAFVMDPTTGQPLARATVKSEVRGTAVAHARIFLNGGGANRSNPVETGETSAVGRDWRLLYSVHADRNELTVEAVRKKDAGTYRP